jgi:hypothetical protein
VYNQGRHERSFRPRSDDPERDKRIVDLVIGGKRVDHVAKMMDCTAADVNLAGAGGANR